MRLHEEKPELGYSTTMQICFLDEGVLQCPTWLRENLLHTPHIGQLPTMVIRRTVFERVGFFNEALPIGSDGLPTIFMLADQEVIVTKCGNISCSLSNSSAVLDGRRSGSFQYVMATGADGLPVTAYTRGDANFLLVTKCKNSTCSSMASW